MIYAVVILAVLLIAALVWARLTTSAVKPASADDPAERAIVVDFAARKAAEAKRIDALTKEQLKDEANLPPGAS